MLKITRYQDKELLYYEATFLGGNLLAFSIVDIINQLCSLYPYDIKLFEFHAN